MTGCEWREDVSFVADANQPVFYNFINLGVIALIPVQRSVLFQDTLVEVHGAVRESGWFK